MREGDASQASFSLLGMWVWGKSGKEVRRARAAQEKGEMMARAGWNRKDVSRENKWAERDPVNLGPIVLLVAPMLLVIIICCATAKCQDAPSAVQPPYPHAWFALEAGGLAGAIFEDGRGYASYEHQSLKRFSAINVPIGIGLGYGALRLENSRRKPLRVCGHVLMWGAIAFYSTDYFRR